MLDSARRERAGEQNEDEPPAPHPGSSLTPSTHLSSSGWCALGRQGELAGEARGLTGLSSTGDDVRVPRRPAGPPLWWQQLGAESLGSEQPGSVDGASGCLLPSQALTCYLRPGNGIYLVSCSGGGEPPTSNSKSPLVVADGRP